MSMESGYDSIEHRLDHRRQIQDRSARGLDGHAQAKPGDVMLRFRQYLTLSGLHPIPDGAGRHLFPERAAPDRLPSGEFPAGLPVGKSHALVCQRVSVVVGSSSCNRAVGSRRTGKYPLESDTVTGGSCEIHRAHVVKENVLGVKGVSIFRNERCMQDLIRSRRYCPDCGAQLLAHFFQPLLLGLKGQAPGCPQFHGTRGALHKIGTGRQHRSKSSKS